MSDFQIKIKYTQNHYLYTMYWNQSYEEVQREIKETVESIRRVSENLRRQGPDACRQFLIDAGIEIEYKSPTD